MDEKQIHNTYFTLNKDEIRRKKKLQLIHQKFIEKNQQLIVHFVGLRIEKKTCNV